MAGPDRLSDFEGTWRVRRRIEDRLGPDARFEGSAVFAPDGGGLTYTETGQLTSAGQSFAATRRYLWRDIPAGIEVLFEDGRPFHQFGLAAQATAGHDCAPDRYDVRYEFGQWPVWQSIWEVRGPRKDYRMVSVYRRA